MQEAETTAVRSACRGECREASFRKFIRGLRARQSLNAEEIQELADALSRLWRARNHLYTNRLAKAAKMLQGMIDAEAREVASTGDATTHETDEVASTGDATSPEKSTKEAEKENPPCTPLKEKGKKHTHTHIARARRGVHNSDARRVPGVRREDAPGDGRGALPRPLHVQRLEDQRTRPRFAAKEGGAA